MNDFEWVDYIPPDIHDGFKFIISSATPKTVYTMVMGEDSDKLYITWKNGRRSSIDYQVSEVRKFVLNGKWVEV